ncbi:hypothetical protein PUNSTDRAFT_54350 [Punctularia strigosozonata HHB-11173 SS5]|uniref:uncharacterized protein n=1 Tax=Punctularia strigosozonata (strain HHB-11173) TaxID=741275 RepID=UPI00044169CC|nr:uncharacterized protein PUNSTDRAFT_54350 [Punctularia strigosozonata HHB-11173 SS5]EIN06064.1 hypothetical protein PUNSTDRAFT_54350 [Punctularia strigosozonata HHB-11173 SS5]
MSVAAAAASASSDSADHNANRPTSIDLSLELERQLDSIDSPLATPAPLPATGAVGKGLRSRPQSLDPHVLASIVTQLRDSLAQVTKERDDLVGLLAESHAKEAGLKDALEGVMEKCERAEDALHNMKLQHQEDVDTITTLRSKVDESRRGLMKLQAESRRMSQSSMTLDLARANAPLTGGKRPPFTPLTGSGRVGPAGGRGHRRGVSMSEGGFSPPPSAFLPDGAGAQITQIPPTPESPAGGFFSRSPGKDRRASGFFGRTSPVMLPGRLSPDHAGGSQSPPPSRRELEALRREMMALRTELDETRAELTESNEAREASETCVKALREYIAQSNIGEGTSASAPSTAPVPVPIKRESSSSSSSGSGWGFRLWSASAPTETRSMPPPPPPAPAAPAPVHAASKFGSFFANPRRSSYASSTTSSLRGARPEPLMEDNRESDEDESTGPVSPTGEEAPRASVTIQEQDGARESS